MKTVAVTNKNKPGRKPEHTEALQANEIWEREKLNDFKEGDEIYDFSQIPYIGEFADHDPEQGAAIDHAIATGEGLFA